MVDFEGGKRGGFERDEGIEDALGIGSNEYQDSPATGSAATRIMVADANGVVNLPAGTSLEDFEVRGRDLVINLADGTTIVIPDGAINTPLIMIDGNLIPPAVVSAALNGLLPEDEDEDGEFNPEDLPELLPSSGGNFAGDVGAIQDAFDLGNLLPYTELGLTPPEEEEVIPFENTEPDVVIETPDNPVGVENAIATVAERGLPERGEPSEPEGTADETDAETTSGTIVFNAPDGLSAIILNGEEVTTVGQEFVTPFGTLTITSINLDAGEIGFSYTLADNLLGETEDGNFFVTVIDRDGDTADATLSILVEDDSPIAADDIGIVPAGTHAPISGNVLDNDEPGADDYPMGEGGPEAVTGFSSNATGNSGGPGDTIEGDYGVLTLNADGSYSYVRDFNTPGGVSDVFEYTIVDQDGSTDSATLTIEIGDAPDNVEVPTVGDATVVEEGGLPPRGDEPVGTGEGADDDPGNNSDPSEATSGTITFNSPDGVESVSINGVPVDPAGLPQTIVDDDTGTLVITDYTYDPATGDGTITYEYTLGDNTSGDDTSVSFEVVVTDLDGDTASDDLVITIVDDVPDAIDDAASQDVENAPVTVDVFANDVEGADGVALDAIAAVEGSLSGAGSLAYNGDGTFTYTPAPGEEGQVTFQYSITDGDGDSDIATVTIDLLPDSTPEISAEGEDTVDEAGLPARGDEPAGSDEASDSEFTQGNIFISTGGDTIASLVINGVNVTSGGTVTTAKGVLTVTEDGGAYSYTYELTDNTLSDPDSDSFSLVVTDSDGDMASTSIVIAIQDDVPSAEDDANSIAAGQYGPVGGNVMDNDTQGADGAVVTAFSGSMGSGGAGDEVQGDHGKLTINADGSYTYVRDPGTPGGVTDTFSYTITDGDGDTASANLVIAIGDSTTTLDLPVIGEDGTLVDEAGLDGPPNGADVGTDAAADSEVTAGSFTYSAPDGPATVFIDGVEVTGVGQTFAGAFGTLTVTGMSEGVISYSYELTTNTAGDDTFEDFVVRVEDQDDDFSEDTLVIEIVDDEPLAGANAPVTVDEDDLPGGNEGGTGDDDASGPLSGTLDHQFGADGAGSIDFAVMDGQSVDINGVTVTYSWDAGSNTLTANDGSNDVFSVTVNPATGDYSIAHLNPLDHHLSGDDVETDASFVLTYTVTDGDGDTATSTLTVNIDDDTPEFGEAEGSAPTLETSDSETEGGPDSDSASFAAAFAPLFGADGLAASDTLVYSLAINGGDGADSGLNDAATDENILLRISAGDPNVIEAYLETSGDIAFTITLDPDTGEITQEQFRAIEHDDPGDPVESGAAAESMAADLVKLTATITDGDGDQASETLDIGDSFTFSDDGPAFGAQLIYARLDEDELPAGNDDSAAGDDFSVLGTSFTGLFQTDFGADGPNSDELTVSVDAVTANDPATGAVALTSGGETVLYSWDAATNTLTAYTSDINDPVFTLAFDLGSDEVTFTLLKPLDHPSTDGDGAGDGPEIGYEDNLVIDFAITLTDGDGDSVQTGLTIEVDDDMAVASANSQTVVEGASDGGNVVTDDDGDGTDSAGADGFAADGPVVDADFVSADQGITLTDKSVDPDSGVITIVTSAGTLTLDPDGSYTFDSLANSINGDAEIVFSYTVQDGDGDRTSAELTVNLTNVAGDVEDDDVDVDEKGLADGTGELADGDAGNQSDASEIDADGQITVIGASGTFEYALVGGTYDGGTDTYTVVGTYGTLVLNASTGAYTYTLQSEFAHDPDAPGADRNTAFNAENFEYVVSDEFANEIGSGFINVNIVDDIPEVDIATSGDNPDAMVTFDEETEGGTSTDTADFSDAFEIDSFLFGADQPGGTLVTTYALVLNTAGAVDPSTLSSDGNPVYLYQLADGTVIGSTSSTAPAGVDGTTVFTLAVDEASGVVTLTQYAELDHSLSETEPGYDDDTVPLPGGLVSIEATATITDSDMDVVSDTASIDLGDYVEFADDGPSIEQNGNALADLVVDESPVGEDEGGDFDPAGVASAMADFSGNFTADFGADGAASPVAITYALSLDDSGGPVGSGLYALDASDTLDSDGDGIGQGDEIMLEVDGSDIVGKAGGVEYFRISVDGDGKVTFSQSQNVWHGDTGDDDDSAELVTASANLLTLDATAQDGDGDTATASIDLGTGIFQIEDDGPRTLANAAVQLDDDALGGGNDGGPGDVDPDSANLTGILGHDFGSDGAGSIDFAAMDGQSVNINGVTVSYSWDAGSNTLTANDGTNDVFSVSVNPATGAYSVTQINPLDHHLSGDDVETDVSFVLTYTVTDADGDSETGTLTVNVDDDTPEFGDDTGSAPVLVTDDTVVEDSGSDTDNSGNDFSVLFDPLYGADGAAASNAITYALAITGGDGTDSGLDDTLTGDDILLRLNGNAIEGYLASAPATIAFTLTLDTANGTITQVQNRAIEHDNASDPIESGGEAETMAAGLITISATITDGDDDSVTSDPVAIGDSFTFEDDGPNIDSVSAGTGVDVDETDAGSPSGFPISDTSVAAVITYSGDFGADGAATTGSEVYTLDIVGDGTTTLETAVGGHAISLVQDPGTPNVITGVYNDGGGDQAAFTVTINGDGTVTLQQNVALEHLVDGDNSGGEHNDTLDLAGLVNATITLKDGDGDSVSQSAGIGDLLVFFDDGPSAVNDTNSLDEDTSSVGGNVLTDGTADDFGGDGPGSPAIISVSGSGGAGTIGGSTTGSWGSLSLNDDGTYTYNLNMASVQHLDVGETETDVFTYQIVDADGDTSTATLTITINGVNDLPVVGTASVAVSDEGLAGGNPDSTGTSDTTDSATASGSISVSDADSSDTSFTYVLGIPTDALSSGGEAISWDNSAGNVLIGSTSAGEVIRITITDDPSNGEADFTVLQSAQIDHADDTVEDTTSFGVDVTVNDGTGSTLKPDAITVVIEDDSPVNFTPVNLTDTTDATVPTQDDALVNDGTAVATRLLNDPDNDGTGTNFIGGDGFGSLAFIGGTDGVTTLQTNGGDPITSGGETIYLFGFGTDTLVGTTDPANADAGAKVFTVTLDPGTGAGNDATYTIDFDRELDDGSGFVFDDFSSAPAGQNDWIGLDADGNDIDVDNNDSEDLLVTPINGTVNTSSTDIGNANQWIDNGEGIRLDFVEDVRRAPGQDEKDIGGYQHDGHYDVTNASTTIMQVGGGGSDAQLTIALFDDDGAVANGLAPDPVEVDPNSIVVKDSGGNVLTAGVHYTVIDNGLTVTVTGLAEGDQVSFEAVGDAVFNAVEFTNDGGGDRFALGVFGFNSAVSGDDLNFSFDVQATDADGDSSTGTIDITVTPTDSAAPVVLDLDGGGNAFTGLDGGVAFDYDGDGVKTKTAWVAAGSAILAYDMNGDGIVTDASEFVFGGDGMTDLEAIAAKYDENGDNVLDANDAAYGKFGVWLDADMDGVSDAGEFVSLSDAGIASINLVSDGIQTIEADGDVTVFGTSSYTMADGSTGAVSDAAFATGSDVDPAMMEALLALETSADEGEQDAVEAAGLKPSEEAPELARIVDDVLAESAIDQMLDTITGENSDIVGKTGENGYLGEGALAQTIETGAFAFGGNTMADMQEDAAALASLNA